MTNGKKKLLIVNNNLATGGVQRSLVNLLSVIKDSYDVTLFVFSCIGNYKEDIPKQVKVIEARPLLKLLGLSQKQAKKNGYILYYFRAVLALCSKVFTNRLSIHLLISTQPSLLDFDIAISFLHQNSNKRLLYGGCNEFVLRRVRAKQKITFIHTDFLNYGGNIKQNRKVYKRFDKITAVSEGCLLSFNKAVPELKEKTYCVYNCHNYPEYILKANDNPLIYSKDYLIIVTVARLSSEKGILRGLSVINRLNKEGYKIHWHIIGDGPQRKEIEDQIYITNVSDRIILHGDQENPFRYMKNADILFLPSFHEAAPMVFHEAKCLSVPIVTTDTTSAKEMVAEGKEGFICKNSEYGIYETLKTLLDNPRRMHTCKEYLVKQQYTNEKALLQFHSLIEGRI